MAKKNNISVLSIILHIAVIVLGALVFAFLALPYYQLLSSETVLSGYNLFNADNSYAFNAIVMYVIAIAAGLSIVAGALALLCDFNVIPSKKANKVVSLITLCVTAVLAVGTILSLIAVPACASHVVSDTLLTVTFGDLYTTLWGGVIAVLVCGLGSVACSVVATLAKKK